MIGKIPNKFQVLFLSFSLILILYKLKVTNDNLYLITLYKNTKYECTF